MRPSPPAFLLIQEPPVVRGNIPTMNGYQCLHPPYDLGCPTVATFILSSFARCRIFSLPPMRSDLLEVHMVAKVGLFSPIIPYLRLLNVYRMPRTLKANSAPISPQMLFGQAEYASLMAGNFNLHHLATDPTRLLSDKEFREADPFFSLASDRGYNLLNTLGIYMQFSFTSEARPGMLDLAFASMGLRPFTRDWSTPFSSTGSNHVPTLITLSANSLAHSGPVPDWDRTHWNEVECDLKSLTIPPPPPIVTLATLDDAFSAHATQLRGIIVAHIPHKVISPRSKPWWSGLLTSLRRV